MILYSYRHDGTGPRGVLCLQSGMGGCSPTPPLGGWVQALTHTPTGLLMNPLSDEEEAKGIHKEIKLHCLQNISLRALGSGSKSKGRGRSQPLSQQPLWREAGGRRPAHDCPPFPGTGGRKGDCGSKRNYGTHPVPHQPLNGGGSNQRRSWQFQALSFFLRLPAGGFNL